MTHTSEDLKRLQALPLAEKILVTQTRIMEFYMRYGGMVYVSFSGGKDSTVLLDVARKLFPDVPAVFFDTGVEYPEIRNFVKTKENVTFQRPKMRFREIIETYGYPVVSKEVSNRVFYARRHMNGEPVGGWAYDEFYQEQTQQYDKRKWEKLLHAPFKISDHCCYVMKKEPAKKYEQETGRRPIIGTLASESLLRRSAWLKNGCNSFDSKRPKSNPLSFWTEQDILEYLYTYNISYCPLYGDIQKDKKGKYHNTGETRTGCFYCAYGIQLEKEPNRFQRMKSEHPSLWEYCMKPREDGGLGMREVLDYLDVKYE